HLVDPVERLPERDDVERAEIRRQLFGSEPAKRRVRRCSPSCLCDHRGVCVDPDRLREQGREEDRQRCRPAADVEQTAGAVECELLAERVGESLRIRQASARIELRAAFAQRGIPLPGHGTAQICQAPPTRSGTRPPSLRLPVTVTSSEPIMKSMWTALALMRAMSAASATGAEYASPSARWLAAFSSSSAV